MDQVVLKLTTNHLGFKQYVLEDDTYVCPECLLPYTNEGDGVLCEQALCINR